MQSLTKAAISMTKSSVRARLSRTGFANGDIVFDGKTIGRFVSYGKLDRSASRRGARRNTTIYASRIYASGLRIELEATTVPALLNKVSAELAQAMKLGKWASASETAPAESTAINGLKQAEHIAAEDRAPTLASSLKLRG